MERVIYYQNARANETSTITLPPCMRVIRDTVRQTVDEKLAHKSGGGCARKVRDQRAWISHLSMT